MPDENAPIKTLTINSVDYAKYSFEDSEQYKDMLFLKVLAKPTKLLPLAKDIEEFCIMVICVIEDRDFDNAAYLNI